MTLSFSTGAPKTSNIDSELTVSMPIINSGPGVAANVKATDITLGLFTRVSPAGLPVFLASSLLPLNFVSVSPRFDMRGLTVGNKYLFTVRGTYETDSATLGFAVNRYIVVPSPSQPPASLLKAHVRVAETLGVWTYAVSNDEPLTSQQYIAGFSVDVVAPVTVTGSPPGWQAQTDNASYVYWSASDQQLPYPHHILPGGSLGGFQIQSSRSTSESTGCVVAAWDHQADKAGLVSADWVLSPSRSD